MVEQADQARAQVRASIKRRGRQKFNVWTGFASKGNASQVVLDGTPKAQHLIWMEGDPEVVKYNCPALRGDVKDSDNGFHGVQPDAICVLRSNKIEWRKILGPNDSDSLPSEAKSFIPIAQGYNATWRFISAQDLADRALFIRNWRTGLSYLWAASDFDLSPFTYDINTLLAVSGVISVRELLSVNAAAEALVIAAAFFLAQIGEITSDLDTKPFGYETVLRRACR